jgi:hypothetical protein
VFGVVSEVQLYPGAAVRCILLPGELIIVCDAVADPLSLTVIDSDDKCLSVSITVSDAVVISDSVPLAVTLTVVFPDVINDENSDVIYLVVVVDYDNSNVIDVVVVVDFEHGNVIYLMVRFDNINCDSVGVDELVVVCDAVTVPISVGVELSTAIVVRERESLHFDVSIALNVRVRFGVSEPE